MKQIQIKSIILFIVSLFLLAACNTETESGSAEEHKEIMEKHSETVRLSPQEIEEFGIELAQAGPAKLQTHVSLPGEVIIPPDNLAHIHPRFPGMVKEVRKTIGDKVEKGEVLAVIESNESLVDYQLKSFINGTVIEMHMTRGEMIDDGKHGFVVADLGRVWIYLQVYQKDLPYVRKGQKVVISAGKGMPETEGTINYISPIIDEITRTTEARVVLRNRKGVWKPGLFVTGRIITENVSVDVAVPKTALETFEGKRVVFIKESEGFRPQPVHINRENDTLVEVVHGLKAGQAYVSKNAFTLKAELMKSEFGEGHGH